MQQRLKKEKRQRKKVIAAYKNFIRLCQFQIWLINLMKEQKLNPFLHIFRLLKSKEMKRNLPPSTHFYVTKATQKKITQIKLGHHQSQTSGQSIFLATSTFVK